MDLADRLVRERRARLAAERLLDLKSRELQAANEKLALHARALSDEVRAQRQVASRAQVEADLLKGQQGRFLTDLDRAHTAAVMAEARLRDSIDTIRDGFAVFDTEGRLVVANRAYATVFGQPDLVPGTPLADVLAQAAGSGLVDLADEPAEDWVARLLRRSAEDPIAPELLQLAGGRWLRLDDRRARNGDLVTLAVDITDEKATQADLEAARAAAEAASRAKSAFLANMSHEIRTPMNGVVGMAELLCSTALGEEQRLFAETIRSSGEALLVIINDILDYSKLEAARLVLRPEPFDLERILHEIAILLRPKAREKNVEILIDFDMFLPTAYIGDPGRLRQILTNLMGNAVKFTDRGHVLVRLVGVPVAPDRQQLHVTVEDTGIGIAPEHLGHIFGEFNQVEDKANRRFEGTGLGLAITRQLVERMEGEVWVDSVLGKGSVFGFRLVLPVAEAAPAPDPALTLGRVLVVDDRLINRTILERQLSVCTEAVALARSGAEALAAVTTAGGFDLVLADEDLGDMPAPALAGALRRAGQTGPVVLLSAQPGDLATCPDLSAVLQKPILRADLYRRLADLLAPAPVPATALPPLAAEPDPARRPMRVLVAEDNHTNQLVFAKMVKDCALDLHFAANGREAVEMWGALSPDLIFMDVSMPEMDGRQATGAIRAAGGRLPILALTAHASDEDAAEILAAGMDRHLTKPLRRSVILEVLEEFRPSQALPLEAPAAA